MALRDIFLEPPPRRDLPARLVRLFVGLTMFGFGVALMVRSELGLSPWEVLHQGISFRTGILLGTVGIIVGFFVLFGWIPLREKLGIGTVANVVMIGIVIDLSLWQLPEEFSGLGVRWMLLIAGISLIGVGTSLYIGAGLGPGPRDGLMTGIAKRGMAIGLVRTAIELSVLAAGWLLGGTVGIGTVLFALGVGPIVHWTLPFLTVEKSTSEKLA
ncbi:MAG: hypothetical protein HKN91_11605 [Acidimicrobiia bacterium]|nr:hypothetical protein [Acidimicrobiia bacterium]